MGLRHKVRGRAYRAGMRDGLDWDLEDFESVEEVRRSTTGWDDATISAIGSTEFRILVGVVPGKAESEDERLFADACRSYNLGAYRGATRPQEVRRGNGPLPKDFIEKALPALRSPR